MDISITNHIIQADSTIREEGIVTVAHFRDIMDRIERNILEVVTIVITTGSKIILVVEILRDKITIDDIVKSNCLSYIDEYLII